MEDIINSYQTKRLTSIPVNQYCDTVVKGEMGGILEVVGRLNNE